jgi:hypothetical protein
MGVEPRFGNLQFHCLAIILGDLTYCKLNCVFLYFFAKSWLIPVRNKAYTRYKPYSSILQATSLMIKENEDRQPSSMRIITEYSCMYS